MARGVQISLTLNPREFIRGLRKIELGTEDVVDALDEVEKAGDDAFDLDVRDAERALDRMESGTEDVESAFESLSREAKSEIDEIETAARNADVSPDFDSIDQNIKGAAGGAKAAAGVLIGEIASELTESWGEAVRSGDYGEAIRETFSNLAQIGGAAFGPIGALGGAGASVILTGFYDKLKADALRKEELQALAEGVSTSLFDLIVDRAEEKGTEAGAQFQKAFKSVEFETSTLEKLFGDLPTAMAAITQQASEWGLEVGTVKDAYLGNADAVAEVEGRLADIRALQEANGILANKYLAAGEAVPEALEDQISALNTAESEMTDLLNTAEGVSDETAKTKAGLETYEQLYGKAEKGAKKQKEQAEGAEKATKGTKDNVANTKDKGLPKLEGSTKRAKDDSKGVKDNVAGVNDKSLPKLEGSLDRARTDAQNVRDIIANLKDKTVTVTVKELRGKDNAAASRASTGQQP